MKSILCVLWFSVSAFAIPLCSRADETVNFQRDVLPILSDKCFQCHGPDQAHRKADLRLDQRESAVDLGAVVPGNAPKSNLISRITTDDPDLLMPPAKTRKKLSAKEIETLRTWIASGAEWGRHWSFERPTRAALPNDRAHPVDEFVQAQLERKGLEFAERAQMQTLLRRVSFDLIGLPPTKEEVDAVLSSKSPNAYGEFVDRLLASRHFGERMAMWWLDAARYSDTDGYQGDATRTNWPWRDWVIQSFNKNMPFDQFTVEQFAGDLLPNATAEQKLATCFHRNHMTNGEGGRDPEESRIDYVIDRINTTGSVWLGLTLGCCQCHSHKFDPISQKDYYSLFAFFNSIDEDGRAGRGAKPYLKYKSPFAQRAVTEAQDVVNQRKAVEATARKQAEQDFDPWLLNQLKSVGSFQPWHTLRATSLHAVEGSELHQGANGIVQVSGPNPRQDDYRLTASAPVKRVTGLKLEVMPHPSHTDGKLSRGKSGEFILTDVKLQIRQRGQSQLRDIDIAAAIADAEKNVSGRNYGKVKDTLDDDPRNGWTTETHDAKQPHVAVFALAEPLVLADDEELIFVMLHRSTRGDANIGRFRLSVTDQPGRAVRTLGPMPMEELKATGASEPSKVAAGLRGKLLDQFLSDYVTYQQAKADLDRANGQLSAVKRAAGDLNVMVLAARKSPRKTHVLVRGVWNKKGDEVSRSVPASVLSMQFGGDSKPSRLDFAKWLVARENPLTARVIVNQLWQMCFGAGLVRTPEDFGLQGEPPTHPKLLDWLAVEFMEHDWDVQHILRVIVTSQTYQQTSRVTPEMLELDPENRLLARASRFRLPAWMIRDAALRSSGLLNPAIGGPTVMAYQPDGVWAEMFMGRFRYEPSQGPAQFRRTLYTFWRRAAAPTFLFDSAQRRVCEVRPRRTNTPLHALTLLNDVSLLESSRALARSAISQTDTPPKRFEHIFRRVVSRSPTQAEQQVLARELAIALTYYKHNTPAAKRFLQFGQPEKRKTKNAVELAAYTIVASMVYNLDEAITHE